MDRRALTIGVSAFSRGEDLPFTSKLVTELAEALEAVGYSCTSHPAKELPSAELGSYVARELQSAEPDLVQVVHVLTHGELSDGDATVYAVGSDGMRHPNGDIAHWLNTVQNSANRPLTLFLLDLCHAGSLARQTWQARLADGRTRAWVIAATEGGKSAYDGRFTQAVINVLRAAANGELDIDPTCEHIPLQVIAPAIRREVNRLTAQSDGYQQDVTASVIDISAEVDPPFFPNPRYAPGNRDLALRASLDPGLVPFLDDLDEGLDARHFIERASGFDGMIGCFAGREAQLKQLSPWLNRHGSGNLAVITGSPGVGKSAILGVLVCAAHPKLRARTKNVWDRAARAPYPIDDGFAAIHARQRSLPAVVTSLAAQLDVDSANLIDSIRALAVPPVIVVDALDEADNGVAILNELLIPLSTVARVLVGTRDYDQYKPLLHAADFVVNLDDVETGVLQEDLFRYVSDLLGATAYRDLGAIRGAFATEVAKALVARSDTQWGEFLVAGLYTRYLITTNPTPVTDPYEAERLGRSVPGTLPEVLELDLAAHPNHPWLRPVLSALARAHGQGMPASVLTRAATAYAPADVPADHPELRRTLDAARFYLRQATDTDHTTLYRLFHQGLADHLRAQETDDAPARLLERLLAPLGPPDARDWSAAEPYVLRHAIQHFNDANRIDEVINDPDFLLTIDPDILDAASTIPALDHIAAVLRQTITVSPAPEILALNAARAGLPELAERAAKTLPWQPIWTAGYPAMRVLPGAAHEFSIPSGVPTRMSCGSVLGIPIASVMFGANVHFTGLKSPVAINLGAPDFEFRNVALSPVNEGLAAAIVSDSWGRSVITWNIMDPDSKIVLKTRGRPSAMTFGSNSGSPVLAVAADQQVRIFNPTLGTLLGSWPTGHPRHIVALACSSIDDTPIVVSADAETLRVWDLGEGKQIGHALAWPLGAITAMACTTIGGRPVAVTAHQGGTVRVWALDEPQPLGEPISGLANTPTWLDAFTLADGSAIAVIPDGNHVQLWNLNTRRKIDTFDYENGALAGALAVIDGVPTLAVANQTGTLKTRKLGTRSAPVRIPKKGEVSVNRVALIGSEHPLTLVAGIDGSVTCRNLKTGTERFDPVQGHGVLLVELREVTLAGEWRVVLTDTTGNSRVWDPRRGRVDAVGGRFPARPSAPTMPEIVVPIGGRLRFVQGFPDGRVFVSDLGGPVAEHAGRVTALAAMKFGQRVLIFSGATDGTVQVRDLYGRWITGIRYLAGAVEQIEVSQDGYLLIVAGGELVCGRLRV